VAAVQHPSETDKPLADGTGWRMERRLEDGEDHAVVLRLV
jgi:hypothetical protein